MAASQRTFEKLDLNLLKVFEALWHHRNMTRAANVLHLTPSAVSHAVSRLRSVVGDPLFERDGHTMSPTPACERLAPKILSMMREVRQTLASFSEFNAARSTQRFVIAMPESMELRLIPKLHATLALEAPNISITSVRLQRSQMVSDLSSGHIHLALDVGRPTQPLIRHQKIHEDTFCVLMRKQHPCVSRLTEASYLAQQHISVSSRSQGAAIEELGLQDLGVTRRAAWRCQTYRTAAEVIARTDALLTLPRAVAEGVVHSGLAICPVPFTMPPINTHLYWHQQQESEPGHHWFLNKVTNLFNVDA